MATAVFPSTHPTTWPQLSLERFAISRARARVIALAVVTSLAFGYRAVGLSTYGLSEDEVNKVRAIEQYRHGHFGANAEHPMLMKLAMWGSVELTSAWNRVAPTGQTVAMESAIRLPNVLAGTLTTLVLFGLADMLFGDRRRLRGVAALGARCERHRDQPPRQGRHLSSVLLPPGDVVLRARQASRGNRPDRCATVVRAERRGLRPDAGLEVHAALPGHLCVLQCDRGPESRRQPTEQGPVHYGAMLVAFVAANLAVLMPETWQYCVRYVQGTNLVHHGYLYAQGQLYVTNIPTISPLGVPATFYLRLFATKVPLPVLGATVAGLIELVRRRRERGFVLLRVWLVFVLVPYSLMAAKFMRYALPLFAAIDLIAAVGFVAGISWLLRKGWLSRPARATVSVLAAVVSISARWRSGFIQRVPSTRCTAMPWASGSPPPARPSLKKPTTTASAKRSRRSPRRRNHPTLSSATRPASWPITSRPAAEPISRFDRCQGKAIPGRTASHRGSLSRTITRRSKTTTLSSSFGDGRLHGERSVPAMRWQLRCSGSQGDNHASTSRRQRRRSWADPRRERGHLRCP